MFAFDKAHGFLTQQCELASTANRRQAAVDAGGIDALRQFAKQAEELADKAKEAAKNVDADQVAETAHDLADKAKGTAGGKFEAPKPPKKASSALA